MALARTPEPSGRLNPVDSVAAYRSTVLGAGASGQPLPRQVMQTTTPKVPYSAKTGSGTYMPNTGQTGVFDIMNQASQTSQKRSVKRKQERQATTSTGYGAPSGGGNYKTASGPVGARGVYGLEKVAGSRLQALQSAYRQQFGTDLPINSGGRTRAEQTYLYNLYKSGRGNLAAPPGTSVHESGRAVDFGGAAHGYSQQQTWLVNNAPKFGWYWAGKNFSQVEPWHFEYSG